MAVPCSPNMGRIWVALALLCVALSGACARSVPRKLAASAGAWRVLDVNTTGVRPPKRGPKPPSPGGVGIAVQNGYVAGANDFPYFATLLDDQGRWAGCGGALIRGRAVVTAAHCVMNNDGTWNKRVQGVYINQLSWYNDGDFYEFRRVTRYVVPAGYKPQSSFANDIAILILDSNAQTAPVTLASAATSMRRNENLWAPGFGATESSYYSDVLKYAYMPWWPTNECNSIFTRRLGLGTMPSTHICAGWSTNNQDTCQGDSGGPLIKNDNGRAVLVGVTSYGPATTEYGCSGDSNLGAYTSVRAMRPFIDNVVRQYRL